MRIFQTNLHFSPRKNDWRKRCFLFIFAEQTHHWQKTKLKATGQSVSSTRKYSINQLNYINIAHIVALRCIYINKTN